jgi:hypothetical protein
MTINYFYDTPNAVLLFVFIVTLVALALIGLYIFTVLTGDTASKVFFTNNTNTGTYISAIATAIALLIAFIISNEWQTFTQTQNNLIQESNDLYLLYITVFSLTGAQDILPAIINYICSIINIEFPIMKQGEDIGFSTFLDIVQAELLSYVPITDKDRILYTQALDLLNDATALRNTRAEVAVAGIPSEFWWMLVLGFIVLSVMIWFITGNAMYRIYMTTFVTIIYATLLFLVVILAYPFRGSFGLSAEPFIFVLDKLNATCPSDLDPPAVTEKSVRNNNFQR